jgi:hypothetical protein
MLYYYSTPAPLQGISINADHCMGSVILNIRIDNAMTAFIPCIKIKKAKCEGRINWSSGIKNRDIKTRLILKEERQRKGTNRLLVCEALSS